MNKKGFTLIEMIVTVTLLCTLLLLVVPGILSQLSSRTNELSEKEQEIIIEAGKAYISKYNEKYEYNNETKVYCISLEQLKKEGLYTPTSRTKYFGDDSNYSIIVTVNKESNDYVFKNEACS